MRTTRIIAGWILITAVVGGLLFMPGSGLLDTAPLAATAFGLFGLAAMRQHGVGRSRAD